MRWTEGRRSDNVEDRRRIGRPALAAGGGIGAVVILLAAFFLGGDPRALLNLLQDGAPAGPAGPLDPAEEKLKDFVSVVLADTEDVWTALFAKLGKTYSEPQLVLFTAQVNSACGFANAAVGPFYCPGDEKAYIDLGFFADLQSRFRAPGDFAQAYVLAHEIGHHVQNLLGISDKVDSQRGRVSAEELNALSVRLELQADFLAGVWAHHAQKLRNILEPGDIEEALGAASAIGDDRLQMEGQGYVVPDSFTHGTSEQRSRWFRLGLETGDLSRGDTFKAREL